MQILPYLYHSNFSIQLLHKEYTCGFSTLLRCKLLGHIQILLQLVYSYLIPSQTMLKAFSPENIRTLPMTLYKIFYPPSML